MTHTEAFFLVARDLMWVVVWLIPPLIFFYAGTECERYKSAWWAKDSFMIPLMVAMIFYLIISFMLHAWGRGEI